MTQPKYGSGSLKRQVLEITRSYSRQGSKKSRSEQISRMCTFAEFCQARRGNGVSLGQLGDKDVIAYWKHTNHLAPTTLRDQWYALRTLWSLLDKGLPRKPFGMQPQVSKVLEPDALTGED